MSQKVSKCVFSLSHDLRYHVFAIENFLSNSNHKYKVNNNYNVCTMESF